MPWQVALEHQKAEPRKIILEHQKKWWVVPWMVLEHQEGTHWIALDHQDSGGGIIDDVELALEMLSS